MLAIPLVEFYKHILDFVQTHRILGKALGHKDVITLICNTTGEGIDYQFRQEASTLLELAETESRILKISVEEYLELLIGEQEA